MKPILKTASALGVAGALMLSATAPSSADDRWAWAAGGFAVGALVGSAAVASSNYYYGGSPYAYSSGYYGSPYNAYAYEPTYVAPAPAYTYVAPAPTYTYVAPAPVYTTPAYDAYAYEPTYVAPVYAPRYRGGNTNNYNRYDPARGNIGG